jgi:hypothetical protein
MVVGQRVEISRAEGIRAEAGGSRRREPAPTGVRWRCRNPARGR